MRGNGFRLPLSIFVTTGSAKPQCDTIVNGIKIALEEAGYRAGPFEIEYADWDDATAGAGQWTAEAETANAVRAVHDPDVMAYLGTYNSGAAKISMPILNKAGLLMLSPANTWPGLTKPGKGDPGGVSYGTYQLASKVGRADQFVQKYYPDEFKGLKGGTDEFTKKWKKLADQDPKALHANEHAFIKETHYDPQVKKLEKELSLDVAKRSAAFRDMVWSVAVQHGPNTGIIVTAVKPLLADTKLDPARLELEITESAVMKDADAALETLRGLKALGAGLAIDDFGTGYSSLSYLRSFPIDALKVDRSFVREVPARSDDAAIVTAIIAMARSLKLRVIAEGVESDVQQDWLRSHGCDEIQGYLISRPLPAEQIGPMLAKERETSAR